MSIANRITSVLLSAALITGLNWAAPGFVEPHPSGIGSAFSIEKYIRTELYLGLDRKNGPEVTDAEFLKFIDEFVTPRFPSGLTIIDARGQWREDDSTVTKEWSKVLILIYPKAQKRPFGAKIEEIREEYKKRFAQTSVMRIDMGKSLEVSF